MYIYIYIYIYKFYPILSDIFNLIHSTNPEKRNWWKDRPTGAATGPSWRLLPWVRWPEVAPLKCQGAPPWQTMAKPWQTKTVNTCCLWWMLEDTYWLVVGEKPLWNIWWTSSIGMMTFQPNIFMGKYKSWQPNHQPDVVYGEC